MDGLKTKITKDIDGNCIIYVSKPPFNNTLIVEVSFIGRKYTRVIGTLNINNKTLYIKESPFKIKKKGVWMLRLPILLLRGNSLIEYVCVKSKNNNHTAPVKYIIENGVYLNGRELYENYHTNILFSIKEFRKYAEK